MRTKKTTKQIVEMDLSEIRYEFEDLQKAYFRLLFHTKAQNKLIQKLIKENDQKRWFIGGKGLHTDFLKYLVENPT